MSDFVNAAVAAVIVNEHGVLMVRESKPAALGRWALPGGRMEAGETLEDATVREASEETGLDVAVDGLLGIYHAPRTLEGGAALVFAYRASVVGGEIRTSDEHPEVRFVPRAELDQLIEARQVRGRQTRLAVAAFDAGTDLPTDIVTVVKPSQPPR